MELKKLQLPSGITAYLKPDLTAGEFDELQMVFLDSMDIKVGAEGIKEREFKFNPSVMIKAKYKMLEIAVVKLEVGDKVIEPVDEKYIKGMKSQDVEFMAKEADAMYKNSVIDSEAKKK